MRPFLASGNGANPALNGDVVKRRVKFAEGIEALLILAAISINAHAQQLPNQVDLKAGYCIPVAQNAIAGLSTSTPANTPQPSDDVKRLIAAKLDKANTNLRRLQLYLIPRMQYLDMFSIEAARKRGEEDAARATRELGACFTTCQDIACLTKCSGESEALARTRTCDDLSFLPF